MYNACMRFNDRVVIITGGSRGIGLACAERFVREGARVVVTARTQESADEAARRLGPSAVGVAAHAADPVSANACVQLACDRFGGVDVLVNNAGTNPAAGPLVDVDHARFAKTIDVNVWGPLLWSGAVWHASMKERGGVIVNVASIGGLEAGPGIGVYRASKAALIHLTRQLAYELGPGVRVNAVAPGLVRTRLSSALWEDDGEQWASTLPLERLGEPDDVAASVAFLASDEASWITGDALVMDGGQLLGARAAAAAIDAA
jgi:NAD(P)-dependent dehydrogenase (short-subunit alcohol dehydrogenase family)